MREGIQEILPIEEKGMFIGFTINPDFWGNPVIVIELEVDNHER